MNLIIVLVDFSCLHGLNPILPHTLGWIPTTGIYAMNLIIVLVDFSCLHGLNSSIPHTLGWIPTPSYCSGWSQPLAWPESHPPTLGWQRTPPQARTRSALPPALLPTLFPPKFSHLVNNYRYLKTLGTVPVGLIPGLWIRIDSIRIRIQHFCSIRIRIQFRIQAKTELSKTIFFSNFLKIKIWVKSNKKYRCY
jgi:hypothetical protein